jgi:hypothetical protein
MVSKDGQISIRSFRLRLQIFAEKANLNYICCSLEMGLGKTVIECLLD